MLGNGVVGILSETSNKWERRAPLTPAQCARLLNGGRDKSPGVARIIVQPSTKRIFHDKLYEEVGCEISDDLSACGLVLGIKKPRILAERATLFDYELVDGDNGKRLIAFGNFAGRVALIDLLRGLGERYLNLGYSTPFLSLGASYMYPSVTAAKAAVISVGDEIARQGLPSGICPLVFVFTGSGKGSLGAQEMFKLLPHTFVDPSKLPQLFEKARDPPLPGQASERVFEVYGCVVTSQDMVEHKDNPKVFDKNSIVTKRRQALKNIVPLDNKQRINCIYWEKRFPRLLSTQQLQDLVRKGCHLIAISDLTCDMEGSIEILNRTTSIDSPFFRYDAITDSYHNGMEGNGVICSVVDNLPTEFAKEASEHFGGLLLQFIGSLASTADISKLPPVLKKACIAHGGALTPLYEYIPSLRKSNREC
ncbi:hypothetical protein QUC31_020415 [Theobroma cacao]